MGLITDNYFGKIQNLAKHSGEGCYLYSINSECIWINNIKQSVKKKVVQIGDIINVLIDFGKLQIIWLKNASEVEILDFNVRIIYFIDRKRRFRHNGCFEK